MAASLIKGIQPAVWHPLKHYAANNQEFQRFVIDAVSTSAHCAIYLPA